MPTQDLKEQIERTLLSQRHSHSRQGDNGERWIDCRCPLHDDRHRSASYAPDAGVFVCRVCGPNALIPLERVARALALSAPATANGAGPAAPQLQQPRIETARWKYTYFHPDGRLSHYHWRIEYRHHPKRFLHQAPNGSWTRPPGFWPLWGDLGVEPGSVIILTEGEKAAEAILIRSLRHQGAPVAAITAGSADDTLAAAATYLKRLQELQPKLLVLWPDADEAGVKAMKSLARILAESGLVPVLLDPSELQLTSKQDAHDFLERGSDLGLLLSSLKRPDRGPVARDVAARLRVLTTGQVIWPGSETLVNLDQSWCNSLWQHVTGQMPTDRQAKELLNLMRTKLASEPTSEYWRIWVGADRCMWRPAPMQPAYQMSAQGIDSVDDCPGGVLLTPGPSVAPDSIDVAADGEGMFHRLCDLFGLSGLDRAMILAWWVCVLTGRETPIIFLRGHAGSGKSTLASFILALVEPTLREAKVPERGDWTDPRELVQTLRQVPAVLADNVSALSSGMEDVLSRLVTGYNASVMWKYSNHVEQIRMRRGVIMTTTNYDVYKGDLGSRMIVLQPHVEEERWLDRSIITATYMPTLPAIRGWVFKQVCRTYLPHETDTSFRVSSLGDVLTALDFDAPELAAQESALKARVLNQNDAWLIALAEIWEATNQGGEFLLSHQDIVSRMRDIGVPYDALPSLGSNKFSRWVQEKRMLLRDHGFYMEAHRGAGGRGYWFRRVKK